MWQEKSDAIVLPGQNREFKNDAWDLYEDQRSISHRVWTCTPRAVLLHCLVGHTMNRWRSRWRRCRSTDGRATGIVINVLWSFIAVNGGGFPLCACMRITMSNFFWFISLTIKPKRAFWQNKLALGETSDSDCGRHLGVLLDLYVPHIGTPDSRDSRIRRTHRRHWVRAMIPDRTGTS